ncbi:MAG: barstar family protein [Lachnospiraceae bacterium]|nr:barstar family protein [Lachnospiraceae bacterium]
MNFQPDITARWKQNQEYSKNIFSGIRSIFQIMDNCMTSGIMEGDDQELQTTDTVRIKFASPKYYPNSLYPGKDIDVFDGSKRIGTITVEEIVNPVLDRDREKWILIDGREINTTDDFLDLMHQKLTRGSNDYIGRNFNGFNDLLWGGFGFHEYEEPLNFVWIFSEISKEKLGADFDIIVEIMTEHESGKIKLELYKEHAPE